MWKLWAKALGEKASESFVAYMDKTADPEYQEYLRLQKKFEKYSDQ